MSEYDGRFIWYELLTTDVAAAAELRVSRGRSDDQGAFSPGVTSASP